MRTIFLVFLLAAISLHTAGQKLQPLKISDDHRFILTADNAPFFWLGDTAWELFHRLNKEEADLYLTDRAGKGFNVIQAVILAELDGLNTPNAYGHTPLIKNNPAEFNEDYFEHVDYVVKKAGELGIYMGLLPTWGDKFHKAWGQGPEIFTPENAEQFGRKLARRYKDEPNIIWILGGDRWPEDNEDREIIRSMAKGIRAVDKKHLITYHPSGSQKATDFFNEDWLDMDMFQTGHDRRKLDYKFVRDSRTITPVRPAINGEPRYEDHPNRFKPAEFGWMDDSDVRSSAYWTMLSGAAGYTYGAHPIWQMFQVNWSPVSKVRTSWKEALNLPGSKQVMFMKGLLTSFPWQQMKNDQSVILNDNPEDETHIVAAIGEQNDFILAYTPLGKEIKPDLSRLKSDTSEAYWFNPRDGRSMKIGEYKNSEKAAFKPWSEGRGSDFILVIIDGDSIYKLPDL